MDGLFIELYLDEDVSVMVAEMLKGRGFSAATALEAGQLCRSDAEQLRYASANKKALLTHNRVDFERLAQDYFREGLEHYGLIIATRRSPREIVQRLLLLLNQRTADEVKGQILYI